MNNTKMIDRSGCPICKSSAFSKKFADENVHLDQLDRFAFASRKIPEYMHWQLWECQQCDLIYADPIPDRTTLVHEYEQADFSSSVQAKLASDTYASFLPSIQSLLPDLHGVLDIGTGDGIFLEHLIRLGFDQIEGIEPSLAPIQAAKPEIQPLIRHGIFEKGAFSENQFSLVTCFQTIEHVDDPLGMCQEAYRILKPGGAIFLIGHNRRSLSARVLGKRSPIFDLEHLQLFSKQSISQLLNKSGFQVGWVKPIWNRYPVTYWIQLFPLPRWIKSKLMRIIGFFGGNRLILPLPAGNIAVVGYKK